MTLILPTPRPQIGPLVIRTLQAIGSVTLAVIILALTWYVTRADLPLQGRVDCLYRDASGALQMGCRK